MSTNVLFVLVEGKHTDPFFYSRLLRPVCDAAGIPCDIVLANILSGPGGKNTLIDLYKYLDANSSLTYQARNLRKWCIFYMDKDVDDVMRKLIKSQHVVYTPFYCVENGLFMHGNPVDAAAAASSLDPAKIKPRIPGCGDWRRQKAECWKEFLVLSLLSHKLRVNCDCHYGRMKSPLNAPAEASTNTQRAEAIGAELRSQSGLPVSRFDLKLRATKRYVECTYRRGLHDLLFNGKWYFEFLRREINLAAGGKRYNNPSTGALTAALNLTLDFDGEWTEHFRRPLRDLIGDA